MTTNLAALALVTLLSVSSALGQQPEWITLLEMPDTNESTGVSADSLGNVFISGFTRDQAGFLDDAFLSKYDSTGAVEWTRSLATFDVDVATGVAADDLGGVYVTGYTRGDLGGISSGEDDVFLGKYDTDGELEWLRQYGTIGYDRGYGVTTDGLGSVYVSGESVGIGPLNWEAFLSKFDTSGQLEWTRQLSTSGSYVRSRGVSADGFGNVYIAGWTRGDLDGASGGDDAFLSKYDDSGILEWTRQLGTSGHDQAHSVSADGMGFVYITGYTEGNLGATNAGDDDVFLSKFDEAGTLTWTRQLGSNLRDVGEGVFADGLGNVFVTGWGGDLDGGIWSGGGFLSKYDSLGEHAWTQSGAKIVGTNAGVSVDRMGSVYVSGSKGSDSFVTKFQTGSGDPNTDLDGDGVLSGADADLLVLEIIKGSTEQMFDFDGDGIVAVGDLDEFLGLAERLNGDADFDGAVSFADFLVLQQNFGSKAGWSNGDFNASGSVGFSDFLILSTNFGERASMAEVPEPSAMWLLLASVGLFAMRQPSGLSM